jgi:D-alanyl-lipoteichoic acid acyltransferase DltB (MBOAT superfamily)
MYMCYLIYAPLYISGPIVSFNAFATQVRDSVDTVVVILWNVQSKLTTMVYEVSVKIGLRAREHSPRGWQMLTLAQIFFFF